MDNPALFNTLPLGSSQVPMMLGTMEELRSLLLSLPSKADLLSLPSKVDLEAVVSRLKDSHKWGGAGCEQMLGPSLTGLPPAKRPLWTCSNGSPPMRWATATIWQHLSSYSSS